MPTSIGVFLDCDKGKVAFYDMDHMKCLYERQVDCSHIVYPAFALMGSGGQLERIHLSKVPRIPGEHVVYAFGVI